MNAHRSLAALFVAAALTACGAGREEAREPPPVEDTVFGDMVGTMDKARGVQDSMQEQKEQRDREIDSAERDL